MRSIGIVLLFVAAETVSAAWWPIPPITSVHPLGNNWGNYQDYGSGGYFHNGIDVITPDTAGAEVRAVRRGWVKGWGTIQADLHYRLAICDTNSSFTGRAEGWLYAHIDANRWHKNLGDQIQEGELIGYLVDWPNDATFDHLHFARISDTGATWMRFPNVTWWFAQNPLTIIRPNTDNLAPVFENARTNQKFAFCRNNTTTYLAPTALTGDIDIIAKIHDKTGYSTGNPTWDKLAPYRIEHMIRRSDGLVVIPWTLSLEFSNRLNAADVHVVYKNDATCDSRGDYSYREYFYIITNTDGDSIIESSDTQGRWATASVGDANYWVIVRASDVYGNSTTDSMLVTTANGVAVEETGYAMLTRRLQAEPNPSLGRTEVRFGLAAPTDCRLRVYDRAGRIAATPAEARLSAGEHAFGVSGLSAGVYLVELTLSGGLRHQAKLVVTR